MRALVAVAIDVVREAFSRRWILALALVITAVLSVVAFALEIDVVDGAIAASKLFGSVVRHDVRAADVALRPVFSVVSYLLVYGGIGFGILAFADFAPSLLAPGRIEHLLSLPVQRTQLVFGTFAGVLFVALVAVLYCAGGLVCLMWIKTSVFAPGLLIAALFGWIAFGGIYALMLSVSIFVRSATLSAACGFLYFAAGITSSFRYEIAPLFSSNAIAQVVDTAMLFLPPIANLARDGANLAAEDGVDTGAIGVRITIFVALAAAALAVGSWHFDRKDY